MTTETGRTGLRAAFRAARMVFGLSFRADRWRTCASFALSVAEAIGVAALAYGLKRFTDVVVVGDDGRVAAAAAVLVGLGALGVAGNWMGFMVRARLRERTELAVDLRLLDLTMGAPGLEHLERPEYADQLLLLRSQRGSLSGLTEAAALNLGFAVQAATVLALLAGVHPALLALPLFAVPSLLMATRGEAMVQRGHEETAEGWRLRGHLFELATKAAPGKEVRLFSLTDELLGRHQKACRDIDRRMVVAEVRAGLLAAAGSIVFSAGFVGAVAFVAWLAVHGRATAGDVVLAVALATQVNRELGGAVSSLGWLTRAVKVAGRYLWLCDYAAAAEAAARADEPASVPDRLVDGIRLESVAFRYPGSHADVLAGVDLHLRAGSTVALVGDNGAGKTTLVKLLTRLYEPTGGRITVDGVDMRRFDVDGWRERLSAGFQDYVRYEVVAREAVGVGSLPLAADEPAVRSALARANAADVIDALPGGLSTQLGLSFDRGTELSGGQWQKLALGRAMMRTEPLLLLLDEPTAALDAQTEHALFERYAGVARDVAAGTGAITLLVSHRFSTVRMADLIVVLDGGKVAEAGSHGELMAKRGLYAELYELQARAYRPDRRRRRLRPPGRGDRAVRRP
ncbi:MAG TPA: ABC transporter ATP-binding protein [Acidimicrobiales bacterium]|nr:ABC transporter ATP-binding protein [Acidimicrobiales bacterium]